MTVIKGVDASFDELTDKKARDLRAAGYEVYAQCLWTGSQRPLVALGNLLVAIEHGFIPVGYISLSAGHPGPWHVEQGRTTVDTDTWDKLALVSIDVELQGIANTDIRRAVDRVVEMGKRRCIYTSYHCWTDFQGDPQTFTDCLLWNALWDLDEDFDFPSLPYGGWTMEHVVGEQYTGGHDVHGLNADEDVWIKELLIKEEPMKYQVFSDEQREGIIKAYVAGTQVVAIVKGEVVPLSVPIGWWMQFWTYMNGGTPPVILPPFPEFMPDGLLAPKAVIVDRQQVHIIR